MARALFHWYLLREKDWAFGCLPLSKIIKNSPAQYRDAYVYTMRLTKLRLCLSEIRNIISDLERDESIGLNFQTRQESLRVY